MGTESLSNTDLTRFYLPHDLMPDGTNSVQTFAYGNIREGLTLKTEGQATTRSGLTINGETRHDLQLPDRVYNDKYPRLETGSLTVKLPITEHLHLGYGLTFNQVEDPLNTDRLYDERHERFAPHLTADLQTSTISASTQFDYDPAAYGHGLDVQIAAGHEDSLLKAQFQLEHSRQNITRDKETGDVGAVQAFSIAAVKAGEANLSRAAEQTISGSLETNFGLFDVGVSFSRYRKDLNHIYYNGNRGYSG